MIRFLLLLSIILATASCSTTSADKPAPSPEPAPIAAGDHPLGTGSVEFVGFDAAALQDIRVIPEEGAAMFVPQGDTRIENVDGFWWKSSRQWFKIPDHCHTTITSIPDGLQSSPACSKLGERIQRLRGGLTKPGWQEDSGSTGHGTDYPF